MKEGYFLLDSGGERKVERFGGYTFLRPCSQAVWSPRVSLKQWEEEVDAIFTREGGWTFRNSLPESWTISFFGVVLKVVPRR